MNSRKMEMKRKWNIFGFELRMHDLIKKNKGILAKHDQFSIAVKH